MTKEIVILGGGFAGLATAQRLESKLKNGEANITLISRDNYILFTPMLPEVSSGSVETRHIVTPLRAELKKTQFVLGYVTEIDLATKTVCVKHSLNDSNSQYRFDELVFALGAVTSTFHLPGVAENTIPLKNLEDAEILRNLLIAKCEIADVTADVAERRKLLTFIVVGGGYTGVEATGEMADLFANISRFYRNIEKGDVSIILLEAGKSLLAGLPPRMGAYSAKNLRGRGVEVLLDDGVASADADGLTLQSGKRINASTIIWSAGVRPTPVVEHLPIPFSKRGAISVNADMSVPGHLGLWAIGDCASIPDGTAGATYPPTAQHAIREGPVLADNIIATLRGKETKAFKYSSMGSMASLGARRGVAQLPGDFVITGFIAWFLWRSYYLSRLPGLDRKVRVALDWAVGLLFSRDIAELRVYSQSVHQDVKTEA